jgi:DNA-nicking Smr family endonuclease
VGKRRIPVKDGGEPVGLLQGKPVEAELDLHSLDAMTAEQTLTVFLQRVSVTRPGKVVRVITGRGNRSAGMPILQPLVRRFLTTEVGKRVERFVPDNAGGAFLVELSGGQKMDAPDV